MKTLSLAITLFFVLDPFGNLPTMLALLGRYDHRRRCRIILRESFFAFLTLALFYASGQWFLNLLEIGPSDLKICGGVVLGIIALRLVFPNERPGPAKEAEVEPFIVPLAIPLMAGPSALATVMILAAQSSANLLAGFGMMTLAWFATAVILFAGVALGAYIPPRLLAALERLTGLLLSILAVHMLMSGLQAYFPAVRP
jgi:multiple antibiotic resistance protein